MPHGLASSVFLGKILQYGRSEVPDLYKLIAQALSQRYENNVNNIEQAYELFMQDCGSDKLIAPYIQTINPDALANSAISYKKFSQSIVTLTEKQAHQLYESLT